VGVPVGVDVFAKVGARVAVGVRVTVEVGARTPVGVWRLALQAAVAATRARLTSRRAPFGVSGRTQLVSDLLISCDLQTPSSVVDTPAAIPTGPERVIRCRRASIGTTNHSTLLYVHRMATQLRPNTPYRRKVRRGSREPYRIELASYALVPCWWSRRTI
jgi:hypothetical protein